MSNWVKCAVILGLFFISLTVKSVEFPPAPIPLRYVNDYTNTLHTTEKDRLEEKLKIYSQETSSQIAVVLISSTQGYEISQYAFELGDKWGIGRKDLNNGILMLIAVDDRKIFIATGYGLEGVLPDAFLSQIIRQVITPQFKQGFYANGISRGLDHIIAASKNEYAPYQEKDDWQDYIPFFMLAVFVLIVILGEISWRRKPYISPTSHPSGRIIRQSTLSRPSGFGSGHFGGNSGFGGSSGGFGGGNFGGGGAGGSW